eukprot:12791-Amphidinium_carterae.2
MVCLRLLLAVLLSLRVVQMRPTVGSTFAFGKLLLQHSAHLKRCHLLASASEVYLKGTAAAVTNNYKQQLQACLHVNTNSMKWRLFLNEVPEHGSGPQTLEQHPRTGRARRHDHQRDSMLLQSVPHPQAWTPTANTKAASKLRSPLQRSPSKSLHARKTSGLHLFLNSRPQTI